MLVHEIVLVALAGSLCLSATDTADRPGQHVKMGGIKQIRYDRDGNVAAIIEPERATLDEQGVLRMEEVKSVIYTSEGEGIEILASKGQANTEATGDALFEGEIKLLLPDFIVTTSRAMWRESDRTVRGNEKIVLQGTASNIEGSGFVVYTSEDKTIIYRPRGIMRFDSTEKDAKSGKAQEKSKVDLEERPDPSEMPSDDD